MKKNISCGIVSVFLLISTAALSMEQLLDIASLKKQHNITSISKKEELEKQDLAVILKTFKCIQNPQTTWDKNETCPICFHAFNLRNRIRVPLHQGKNRVLHHAICLKCHTQLDCNVRRVGNLQNQACPICRKAIEFSEWGILSEEALKNIANFERLVEELLIQKCSDEFSRKKESEYKNFGTQLGLLETTTVPFKKLRLIKDTNLFKKASFGPYNSLITTGLNDCYAMIWDSLKGTIEHVFICGLEESPLSLSTCKVKEKFLLTMSLKNKTNIFMLGPGLTHSNMIAKQPRAQNASAPVYSPNSSFLAATIGHIVLLYSVTNGAHTYFDCKSDISYLAFSPDEKYLITESICATPNNTKKSIITVWDINYPQAPKHSFEIENCIGIDLSPVGTLIATTSPNQVCLWDWKTGKKIEDFASKTPLAHAFFGHNGNYLGLVAAPSQNCKNIALVNLAGTKLCTLKHNSPVSYLSFSEDGHYVAATLTNGAVQIWKRTESSPISLSRKIALESVKKSILKHILNDRI